MYHDYFGLKEQAFSIAVNPRYLYMSRQHKEALAHLLYGVQGGGFVMLTGEVGTGKTTIVRSLLEQLPENTEIAIILNPMAKVEDLLLTICEELGANYYDDDLTTKMLTDALHSKLLDNHKEGKNTVLLIDEAQLLSADVLEKIRLLTNLETDTKKLLQIILVGQPELNTVLAQPELRQLSQRIVARYHLSPLSLEETHYYIEHRLSVAGLRGRRNPFTPTIVKRIHHYTGGIPRLINVICERTLIGAYGHNKQEIDEKIFHIAKKEVTGERGDVPALKKVERSTSNFLQKYNWQILSTITTAILACLVAIIVLLIKDFTPDSVTPNVIDAPTTIIENTKEQKSTKIEPALTEAKNGDKPEAVTKSENDVTSEPVNTSSSDARFDIFDKNLAEKIFFDYLGFELSSNTPPCWQLGRKGYECELTTLETWDDINNLNRPLILTLITDEKFFSYAIMIGATRNTALIVDESGNHNIIALTELGPLWTGNAFYIWKKPKEFKTALTVGDKSPIIKTIAEQFAILDDQPEALASTTFNRALQKRIKHFQASNGLEDDGILGKQTIMKLNEKTGDAFVLQENF